MSVGNGILFRPLNIGKLTLAGRLIKAATSETRADKDGFATQSHIDFYLPIAKGGTPLIITGNIYVSFDGKSTPLQMGVDDDTKIPALARLVDAVHQQGVKIFAQLSHAGREAVPSFAGVPEVVSASNVKDLSTGVRPRALTVAGDQAGRGAIRRCGRPLQDGRLRWHRDSRRARVLDQPVSDAVHQSPHRRIRWRPGKSRQVPARGVSRHPRPRRSRFSGDHETERFRLPAVTAGTENSRAGPDRKNPGGRRARCGGSLSRALRVRLSRRARHLRPLSAQHGARQRAPPGARASLLVCHLLAPGRRRVQPLLETVPRATTSAMPATSNRPCRSRSSASADFSRARRWRRLSSRTCATRSLQAARSSPIRCSTGTCAMARTGLDA